MRCWETQSAYRGTRLDELLGGPGRPRGCRRLLLALWARIAFCARNFHFGLGRLCFDWLRSRLRIGNQLTGLGNIGERARVVTLARVSEATAVVGRGVARVEFDRSRVVGDRQVEVTLEPVR